MTNLVVPQPITVKSLLRKKCIAPKLFQRRSVWTKADKTPYIRSINKGNALSTIVLVNIEQCMDYCETRFPQCYARFKTYFDDGFRYLILDGQNRLECLKSFYDGNYGVHGNFIDKDGVPVFLKNITKLDTLRSKNPRLYDAFVDASVLVLELSDRNWIQLHELFKDINSGQPLNRMEIRNAKTTFASSYFRNIAESEAMRSLLARIKRFGNDKIQRMLDIETTVKAYIATLKIKDENGRFILRNEFLTDDCLDSLYDKGTGFRPQKDVVEYNQDSLNRFEIIVDFWSKLVMATKTKGNAPMSQKSVWSLLYLSEYLYDRNLISGIVKYDELAKDYNQIISNIEDASNDSFANDLKKYKIAESRLIQEISLSDSESTREVCRAKLDALVKPAKSGYLFHKMSVVKDGSCRDLVRQKIILNISDMSFDKYNEEQLAVDELDESSEEFALASK